MTWRETLYAVDLVALDGEVSWQWEDHFRVAAAMQAAAHELEVSGVLGRLLRLALGDRAAEDGFPECVTACRATGRPETIPGRPHFELSRARRHHRLDQDHAGVAAIVGAIFATSAW